MCQQNINGKCVIWQKPFARDLVVSFIIGKQGVHVPGIVFCLSKIRPYFKVSRNLGNQNKERT